MKMVAAAIMQQNGKILIARRAPDQPLAGKWEFPGGKVEPGESPEECLARELKEELDLEAAIGDFFTETTYRYSTGTVRLLTYFVKAEKEAMRLRVHDAIAWVEPQYISNYDLLPADLPIIEGLVDMQQKQASGPMPSSELSHED